jgi:starch synthase
LLASENGALPRGKIGGVGDVVRDLPAALCAAGWQATVLTPSYGMFHKLPGAKRVGTVDVEFRGEPLSVAVFDVPGSIAAPRNVVFEHALFSPHGSGQIYCSDEPARPFATDASKFALFCAVAAVWIRDLPQPPDVVHLHDWHAATYCALRDFADGFEALREIRTVFTIHNLSYQGPRPISGDESSLESWFPQLRFRHSAIRDPQLPQCFNPLATAIRLADKLSTVSPSYAREICLPSDPVRGFVGGEGLEHELSAATDQGRLVGILNGCNYAQPAGRKPGWRRILDLAGEQVDTWMAADPSSRATRLARERLDAFPNRRPRHVLTSIGRVVPQKVSLMLEPTEPGEMALETLLGQLGRHTVLIMLGNGDPVLQERLVAVAERVPNLLFLCGYSETLSEPLYRAGDLFLMPSTFEPCGISQMLAMRAAQPCVVHGVGGLLDTVDDGRTGFVFDGASPATQAQAFVAAVDRALILKEGDQDRWQTLCIRAASRRFDWTTTARQTIGSLYEP